METLTSETLVERRLDRNHRLYDDTTTWLAEALDGNMRTSFEFKFYGNELYGQDGGALGPIFTDSLESAKNLSANLSFELRRRKHEMDEYLEMIQMMNGFDFNTMVVVSDFPDELMNETTDVGGYNCQRKQTMLRVISKNEDGGLTMQTQSLDRSERHALESIYLQFGHQASPGELLGQRIHLMLDPDAQKNLLDGLVEVYDHSLYLRYGGEWQAGRQKSKFINTYDFVLQQQDLIKYYSERADYFGDNQPVLYGVVATIKRRYEAMGLVGESIITPNIEFNKASEYNLNYEIALSVQQSIMSGEDFNGCGLTISMSDDTASQLGEAGYGSKTETNQTYQFNKKMHCVVCQAPPKEGELKKMCGPCGICRSCDSKLQSKI